MPSRLIVTEIYVLISNKTIIKQQKFAKSINGIYIWKTVCAASSALKFRLLNQNEQFTNYLF